MRKEDVVRELKESIIHDLYRDNMSIDDIDENAPLFDPAGLDLDSLDAFELAGFLEKRYGIEIADGDEVRGIFATISSLADHVIANRNES